MWCFLQLINLVSDRKRKFGEWSKNLINFFADRQNLIGCIGAKKWIGIALHQIWLWLYQLDNIFFCQNNARSDVFAHKQNELSRPRNLYSLKEAMRNSESICFYAKIGRKNGLLNCLEYECWSHFSNPNTSLASATEFASCDATLECPFVQVRKRFAQRYRIWRN